MPKYTIAVLGNKGVGRSSLTDQFVKGRFEKKYECDNGIYEKSLEVEGQQCLLAINYNYLEVSNVLTDLLIRKSDGLALVYSVTEQSSFNDLQDLIDKILRERGSSEVPMILVGNKCDLEDERVVDKEAGAKLADQYKCAFLECSAKINLNVHELFYNLAQQIVRKDALDRVKKPKTRCQIV